MYRLKKCKIHLRKLRHQLYRRRNKLSEETKEKVRGQLSELESAIDAKDKQRANEIIYALHQSIELKKSWWDYTRDTAIGIAIALIIVLGVRQMWFELMEIPSGSMRPTFKESDRLIVAKDTFGLNVPMTPKHIIFEPKDVQRHSVFIFTSEDTAIKDQDTRYFGFPGKKRLIKRNMGMPGDTLYFYGGKIYGVDRDGNPIEPYIVDSVPFIRFEGVVSRDPSGITFHQFGIPLARVENGLPKSLTKANTLGENFGINNYAMAQLTDDGKTLELRFDPTLTYTLETKTEEIPLSEDHLDQIMATMTTSRFKVKNGRAYSHDANSPYRPHFPNIPDGTYEFENGTAYAVHLLGVRTELPENHPLYSHDPRHIQRLFNYGIGLNTVVGPSRYAWWRDGTLYLMGGPIEEIETTKFVDQGPPTPEMIESYGLVVPEKSYLALGDNYAASGDSRIWGFVPEDNLRGTPSIILWPPQERWGAPMQPPYPWFTWPRLIVWIIFILCCIGTWGWRRHVRNHSK